MLLAVVSARTLSVTALLWVFGALAFHVFVADRALARASVEIASRVERRLGRLTQIGIAAGGAAMLTWLAVQASDMAGATSSGQVLAAIPSVATSTRFGHVIVLQMAALLAAAAFLGLGKRRWRAALGAASIGLVLQAAHGHAASMDGGPGALLVSEAVHLLGAGAWLGGLVPLLLTVQAAPPKIGAAAARWFSPLGKLSVAAVAASATFQGWVLVGSVPGLVGTAYGWTALVKVALFAVLCAFAAVNRYRLAPALLRGGVDASKRALVGSIALQTGFGLAVVAAAAVLSSTVPAMHVQPLWPFADRFTLETIEEDDGLRAEVLWAALVLAGAAVLLAVALSVRHRARWPAAAAAAAAAWFAVPHLDLLFVPAAPTSYFRSPTGFAATSIVAGAALFPQHCAACHGANGAGDGPAAKALSVPAADLTAPHLWMHSDGELFWWLAHGMQAPNGGVAMPGFADTLSDEQRWALIDYIRAHNAGLTYQNMGAWLLPVQAPELQAVCDAKPDVTLADLRGRYVRLVIGATPRSSPDVATILAVRDGTRQAAPGLCIADDESVPGAYAIVVGLTPQALAGAQFLIDGAGVLRAVQLPGSALGWDDPKALAAAIQALPPSSDTAGPRDSRMRMPM